MRSSKPGTWANRHGHACRGLMMATTLLASAPASAQDADIPACRYAPQWSVFKAGRPVEEQFMSGPTRGFRILLPVVTAPRTDYRLTLQAGDEVRVEACGCVQTGGKGKTWKRYVNPLGDNADRLYRGGLVLFGTPASYAGLPVRRGEMNGDGFAYVRISDLMAAQRRGFRLRIDRTHQLSLSYEDDDYADNGYWGHDDGNPEQCAGIGGAAVEIQVTRR